MAKVHLQTPVVLIIYQRPDTTAQLLAQIREARPRTLLVVADGPRLDVSGERDRCRAVRKLLDQADWGCEIVTNYAEEHMGCDQRMVSGLKWAFEQVEEAIVLEDDALPHPTFFPFCQELLARYRHDTRVMSICGTNFLGGQLQKRPRYSYYFGSGGGLWGWASWRRAYQMYDYGMKLWPEIRDDQWLANIFASQDMRRHMHNAFQEAYSGRIAAWSYRWAFACIIQSGLVIYPFVNLVSNLGFGPGATRTFDSQDPLARLPEMPMEFPLRHPPFVIRHQTMENFIFQEVLCKRQGMSRNSFWKYFWPWQREKGKL